jgi:hypothetical protein
LSSVTARARSRIWIQAVDEEAHLVALRLRERWLRAVVELGAQLDGVLCTRRRSVRRRCTARQRSSKERGKQDTADEASKIDDTRALVGPGPSPASRPPTHRD